MKSGVALLLVFSFLCVSRPGFSEIPDAVKFIGTEGTKLLLSDSVPIHQVIPNLIAVLNNDVKQGGANVANLRNLQRMAQNVSVIHNEMTPKARQRFPECQLSQARVDQMFGFIIEIALLRKTANSTTLDVINRIGNIPGNTWNLFNRPHQRVRTPSSGEIWEQDRAALEGQIQSFSATYRESCARALRMAGIPFAAGVDRNRNLEDGAPESKTPNLETQIAQDIPIPHVPRTGDTRPGAAAHF